MDKKFLEQCLLKGMLVSDIEKICDKKRSTISYWIEKYGIRHLSKYRSYDSLTLNKIDCRDKAYLLGFILADAAIEPSNMVDITVSINDRCIVDYIEDTFGGTVKINNTFRKESRVFPKARLCLKVPDILKFTGGRLKSDRHYPRIREDLERFMIQGFFDGDGCLTFGRRKDRDRVWQKISFTSGLKVLQGVQQYLLKHLDISTVVRPKGLDNCFVLEFANKDNVLKLCEHIYPDNEFIVLKRKYLKYIALRLELEENGEGCKGK